MSVRNAILGLLSQHPRHGYELRAAFEAIAGGEKNWDVKPAQVYMTLERLEEAGFVSREVSENGSTTDKQVFCLTPLGKTELERWFQSGINSEPQRDEFFIKLMLSLAVDDAIADPIEVIHVQRSKLYVDLHQLTAQRTLADPQAELAHILLLDKAVMHLEADLRWLDMIETRLDDIRRQPLPEAQVQPRGRPKKGR